MDGYAPKKIIDMHLHALPVALQPDGNTPPLPDLPFGVVADERTPRSNDENLALTLKQMDELGTEKAFLSGPEPELLAIWSRSAPGRFMPSVWIDGGPDLPSVDETRRLFESGAISGIGEITSQYRGLGPNDEALDPYYSLAEELGAPVLLHSLGLGGHSDSFRASLGRPLLIEDVLVRHPDLKIWIENAGFPFIDDMVALMYRYPNVYVDISTITWAIPAALFRQYLEQLWTAGLTDRVMYGSDQIFWPQVMSKSVERVLSASFLDDDEKDGIFYRNAEHFLGLPT